MKVALVIVAFVGLICPDSNAQSTTIYGAYQNCPFHCETIKINPDFTFEYRLNGDVFGDQRYQGTRKFVGGNKIKATSPEDHSSPEVTEKVTNRETDFLVSVTDRAGAIVERAVISGVANGAAFKILIGDQGFARIPRCEQFEVKFNGYRGGYKIANSKSDEFLVMLTIDQMINRAIDEIWLIERNRSDVAVSDGSFDRRFWLQKLSRRRERRIFP